MTTKGELAVSRVPPSPTRLAVISFLTLSAVMSPFLFVLPDDMQGIWALAFLYFGLLSVFVAGVVQNSFRIQFWLGLFSVTPMICALIGGLLLEHSENDRDRYVRGMFFFKIALYWFYFLATIAMILSIRGWVVRLSRSRHFTP